MAKNEPQEGFQEQSIPGDIPPTGEKSLQGNPQGIPGRFLGSNQQIMRVWTSRYGNQEAVIKSNAVPVRITVGRPRFQLRYGLAEEIHLFKPAGALFQMNDKEEPRKAPYARLDQVGIGKVQRILHEISSKHGGRDIVLLCFEDVRKPGEWCHRQLVAAWLNEHGRSGRELGVPAQLTLFY